jgi:hypothetical protein
VTRVDLSAAHRRLGGGGQILLSAEQAGITLITKLRGGEDSGSYFWLCWLGEEGGGGSVWWLVRVDDLSAVQRSGGRGWQILLSAAQAGINLIAK